MYKVNVEKAQRLLSSVNPPRVLVNYPEGVDPGELLEFFKRNGFNVLDMGARREDSSLRARVSSLWKRPWQQMGQSATCIPTLIAGEGLELEELGELFPGLYTYVYLYPNSKKSYHSQLLQTRGSEGVSLELLEELFQRNKERVQRHLRHFEEKLLLVLL